MKPLTCRSIVTVVCCPRTEFGDLNIETRRNYHLESFILFLEV
jgi:hypothetical protein